MLKRKAIVLVALLLIMSMLTAIVGCNYGSPDSSSNKQEYSKDLWEEYMLQADYVDNFKIMQLADVQARTAEECNDAFTDIQKLVEKEKPNLIVLTGDNIEVPQSEDVLTALISNMESLNTAWAPVFGNHDAEGVLTKDFMAEKFIASEHCLFYKGEQDVDGVGNFVINLTTESNKIIYSLFLIDSNMYSNGGYDSIHANQIEWYERAVNRLTEINKNKVVPSLTFFHIPLHEFNDAKASYERGESHGSFATFNEQMCPGVENTGFFNVAKELNSTKAIFCGHDHINNCDIEYLGIHLVYGLKSSKCSYYDRSLLGATMITLTSDAMEIRNSFFE